MHVAVARPSRRRSVSVKAVTFTDYGIKAENIPDTSTVDPGSQYDSIGDRWLTFTWLVGESPTWSGPGSLVLYDLDWNPVCRFCAHLKKMPAYAYCLGCDRCGNSHLIPPAPLRERVRQRQRDGRLRGGLG